MLKSDDLLTVIAVVFVLFLAHLMSLSPFGTYYLEIIAAAFIMYFIGRNLVPKSLSKKLSTTLYTLILTFTIICVVSSTGGLASPYFFLTYILLFILAILLETIVALLATMVIMFLFIIQLPQGYEVVDLIPLISMPSIIPCVIFLGQEKRALQREKTARMHAEADSLLFLSVVMKGHLDSMLKIVQNFRGDHDLDTIRKMLRRTRALIDSYEKSL